MIDAHQHFWQLSRGDYGWLTPSLAPIYHDFGPADLAPIIARHGITHTILVQAAPTVAETHYMLAIAAQSPSVAGVVGWVDFTARNVAEIIAGLARDKLLVGLRPMVHDIADDDWLLRDDLAPAVAAMVEHKLVFDALVKPRHLPRLARFIERFRDLQVVIDHGAKPEIAAARLEPWLSDMRAIAGNPAVLCKLSGLITEAGAGWQPSDIRPYCDRLIETFGPGRLVWGSDWPVVNLAGGYDAWRAVSEASLARLAALDRTAILGGNAARVYLSRGRGRPVQAGPDHVRR